MYCKYYTKVEFEKNLTYSQENNKKYLIDFHVSQFNAKSAANMCRCTVV